MTKQWLDYSEEWESKSTFRLDSEKSAYLVISDLQDLGHMWPPDLVIWILEWSIEIWIRNSNGHVYFNSNVDGTITQPFALRIALWSRSTINLHCWVRSMALDHARCTWATCSNKFLQINQFVVVRLCLSAQQTQPRILVCCELCSLALKWGKVRSGQAGRASNSMGNGKKSAAGAKSTKTARTGVSKNLAELPQSVWVQIFQELSFHSRYVR